MTRSPEHCARLRAACSQSKRARSARDDARLIVDALAAAGLLAGVVRLDDHGRVRVRDDLFDAELRALRRTATGDLARALDRRPLSVVMHLRRHPEILADHIGAENEYAPTAGQPRGAMEMKTCRRKIAPLTVSV